MKTVDQQGVKWSVKRRWLPWRRKIREFGYDLPNTPGGDDPISMIIGVIVLIAALPMLVLAFFAAVELLLLLLLLPLFMGIRVVFGGAWTLEVFRKNVLVGTETVTGWEPSRQRMYDICEQIRLAVPHTPPAMND